MEARVLDSWEYGTFICSTLIVFTTYWDNENRIYMAFPPEIPFPFESISPLGGKGRRYIESSWGTQPHLLIPFQDGVTEHSTSAVSGHPFLSLSMCWPSLQTSQPTRPLSPVVNSSLKLSLVPHTGDLPSFLMASQTWEMLPPHCLTWFLSMAFEEMLAFHISKRTTSFPRTRI